MAKRRCANFTDHMLRGSLNTDLCYLNEGYEENPSYTSGLSLLNLEGTPGNYRLFGTKTWEFKNSTTYVPRKEIRTVEEEQQKTYVSDTKIIPLFYWEYNYNHPLTGVNSINRLMIDNMGSSTYDLQFSITTKNIDFTKYKIVYGYE